MNFDPEPGDWWQALFLTRSANNCILSTPQPSPAQVADPPSVNPYLPSFH
jgi:hypothetical protein